MLCKSCLADTYETTRPVHLTVPHVFFFFSSSIEVSKWFLCLWTTVFTDVPLEVGARFVYWWHQTKCILNCGAATSRQIVRCFRLHVFHVPMSFLGRKSALLPQSELFCYGDDKLPTITNAISEGSDERNTKGPIGNSGVKEKSERRNTRETESNKNKEEKLRSSLSLPVDTSFSRLTRALTTMEKNEPRET